MILIFYYDQETQDAKYCPKYPCLPLKFPRETCKQKTIMNGWKLMPNFIFD